MSAASSPPWRKLGPRRALVAFAGCAAFVACGLAEANERSDFVEMPRQYRGIWAEDPRSCRSDDQDPNLLVISHVGIGHPDARTPIPVVAVRRNGSSHRIEFIHVDTFLPGLPPRRWAVRFSVSERGRKLTRTELNDDREVRFPDGQILLRWRERVRTFHFCRPLKPYPRIGG